MTPGRVYVYLCPMAVNNSSMPGRQFMVRLDANDTAYLERVARRLGYTDADTFRWAIRIAALRLELPLSRPLNDHLGRKRRVG